jgi:hypothetical protein
MSDDKPLPTDDIVKVFEAGIKARPELQEGLDELVLEIKSHEAAGINNEGPMAQINFIVQAWGEEGFKALKKMLEDHP